MDKKEIIRAALGTIYHQKFEIYLNNPKVLSSIQIDDHHVTCTFYEWPGSQAIQELKPAIEAVIFEEAWVNELSIQLSLVPISSTIRTGGLKHVAHIIAVSSCKGGVGKSTIALNLATAFRLGGAQVGLFDADIHGPSLPTLLNPSSIADTESDTLIPPFVNNQIKLMSYGYVQNDTKQPAILRGPIASNVFKQLLLNTDWGHLDVLIIDCPPGTGDILLSLTQEIQLDSALIVTTPHELSYADVTKGIEMFKKVNVPISGIIENMSYFLNPETNEKHAIFGKGRLIPTAQSFGIPLWLEFPISQPLASHHDKSTPYLMNASADDQALFGSFVHDLVWEKVLRQPTKQWTVSYDNHKQTIQLDDDTKPIQLDFNTLRLECKCAHCVDEMTRVKTISESDMDPNLTIESTHMVGHYAIAVEWLEHHKRHSSMVPIDQFIQLSTMGSVAK